ncbi:hypothetical protein Hdeb2414_s0007g00244571 [Helianthus debilis subsp. tardiflorus]
MVFHSTVLLSYHIMHSNHLAQMPRKKAKIPVTDQTNALVISLFDSASNSLSDQPVEKHKTGDDLPYRMAIHPGGEGVICSWPKSCRWFEWDTITSDDTIKLRVFK